jgi:KDO2-lipid IV(A) lauroyltransferase
MSARADRRLGGSWTLGQCTKNTLIYWAVCGALRLADALPAGLLLALGRFAGQAAYMLLGRHRRTAERAIRTVLEETNPRRFTRCCFANVGENLAVTLLLRRPEVRATECVLLPPDSRSSLAGALSEGRGVVFVSAHLGPFELVAAAVAELGYRPAVVVRESYDPRLDRLVDAHRVGRGIEVIHRGISGSSGRIVRALRQGRPVGFLTDLGGRVKSSPTLLLGCKVDAPIGPSSIALRARCPLVVGTLSPLGVNSSRPLGRPPWFSLDITRIDAPDEPSLRQSVADELSRRIRGAREQWLWMAPGFPWLRDDPASPYTELRS